MATVCDVYDRVAILTGVVQELFMFFGKYMHYFEPWPILDFIACTITHLIRDLHMCLFHKYYFCVNNLVIQSIDTISRYFLPIYLFTSSLSPIIFGTPHTRVFLNNHFISIYVSLHSNLSVKNNMFMRYPLMHMYKCVIVQAIKPNEGQSSK